MSEQAVLYAKNGHIATITMNRPKSLNSFNSALVEGLISGLDQAAADDEVRVIVLTGSGRAFSAGGDLPSLDDLHTTEERRRFIIKVGTIVQRIHDIEKPVIALVNGVAAGAGFNLAISCDLVYADETAKFIQSFVKVGLPPDCGGFYYLAKTVGQAKAKELMMTARPVDAAEAKALGLVNDIFPTADLSAKVMAVAETIAAGAPLAIAATKKAMNMEGATLAETLTYESLASSSLLGTEDFKEGVKAFSEKRAPQFQGK